MPKDSEVIASCPNPGCGKPIRSDHPYSWCSACGERLPDAIQSQLRRLQEITAQAAAARLSLQGGGAGLALAADAEIIALLYRRLVLLVGLQILLSFLRMPASQAGALVGALLLLVIFLALIGVIVAMVVTAYKLTGRLGARWPVLWALGMFVPCLNIFVLLALSSQAQTWCRRHGIKVGFLGPTKESIEELRQRMMTSTFE
jgi:hypothetical protein